MASVVTCVMVNHLIDSLILASFVVSPCQFDTAPLAESYRLTHAIVAICNFTQRLFFETHSLLYHRHLFINPDS